MKKLLLLSLLIGSLDMAAYSQFIYKIKGDSVLISNDSCTTELIIENATKNIQGFLYNKGNGRTEFRKVNQLNDSTFIIGLDTVRIRASLDQVLAVGNTSSRDATFGNITSSRPGSSTGGRAIISYQSFGGQIKGEFYNGSTWIDAPLVLRGSAVDLATMLTVNSTSITVRDVGYSSDSLAFKPIAYNGAGNLIKMNNWPRTGPLVTSTRVPYGNASNEITSEAEYNYNATTNTLNVDTAKLSKLRIGGYGNSKYGIHYQEMDASSAIVDLSSESNSNGGSMYFYTAGLPNNSNKKLGTINFGSRGGYNDEYIGAQIIGTSDNYWAAGSNYRGNLDFYTTTNGSTTPSFKVRLDQAGRFGIGIQAPTAALHLNAGLATAGFAPFKYTSGVSGQTALENGSKNYDGNNEYLTTGGVNYIMAKTLTATSTLDFTSTSPGGKTDLTLTVAGASDGDVVSIGVPSSSIVSNGSFMGWVSSTNTVTIRFSNNDLSNSYDPASGTFRVSVLKY